MGFLDTKTNFDLKSGYPSLEKLKRLDLNNL